MKPKEIKIIIKEFANADELCPADKELVLAARQATQSAYAPYSNFRVGAAVRLANQEIIRGSNQENAATPAGTCGERAALNWIGANRTEAILAIAVSAINQKGEAASGLSPCGICRQAIAEFQQRQDSPIRVLLDSKEGIREVSNAHDLLPMSFVASALR